MLSLSIKKLRESKEMLREDWRFSWIRSGITRKVIRAIKIIRTIKTIICLIQQGNFHSISRINKM
jgi:hypothetical protein